MERPQRKASHTIHIEVPPNPFWASIGLTVTPLSVGSGTQYKSEVSLGYLNQSFQNAVMEGVRYGMEQGLYGWSVTDCQICFDYGVYYSPVSTPADFRFLAPIVLEQVLKKAGTQLLEPYLSFTIFTPQEYLSRAYNDARKYCAIIESTRLEKDEVIFKGEIPARCIDEYRNDLNFYTNGRSVCITELDAFNVGDVDMIISLYDNNATNHQVANEPVVGVVAIREMFANEFATAKMVCIVENIFEDGQWAILEWRDPLGLRGCGFFQVVNGKILFQRGYWDKLSFLKQHNLPIE